MALYDQVGDVLLFQTTDGGEINCTDGVVEMTPSFETAVYLSLFGGNEEDAGGDDKTYSWWGNLDEQDQAFRYRSRTGYLLRAIPATSGNLQRLRAAVEADLQWFIDLKVASELSVVVSIPRLNTVLITITIIADGEEQDFSFTENWKAAA
jgi:phage gp46-like protein